MTRKGRDTGATKALQLAKRAVAILEHKKGRDIVVLDVRGLSDLTDITVIVTGTSPPHLKAMFDELEHSLEREHVRCYRKAGTPHSGWLILDYVDVVIHMFSQKAREYFAIEELLAKARRLQ
ncbi:MAG: ribosome silencing factor [Kiritimatiellae bacterium]|nr:ribosome silencing factor [Kiritimatiellia bacterium]